MCFKDDGQEVLQKTIDFKVALAAPELLNALEKVVKVSDRKHDFWDEAKGE